MAHPPRWVTCHGKAGTPFRPDPHETVLRHPNEPCDCNPAAPSTASGPVHEIACQGPRSAAQTWVECSAALPACEMPDVQTWPDPVSGDSIRPVYSLQVLVTVVDAGRAAVHTDRVVALDGCAEIRWERFGRRVTHWMPLPSPATAHAAVGTAPQVAAGTARACVATGAGSIARPP